MWINAYVYCGGKSATCCVISCQGFLCTQRLSISLRFVCSIYHCSPKKEAFPSNSKEIWHSWSFSRALSSLGTFEIQTKTGLIPYVFWRVSWLLSQPQLYLHIGHKGESAAGHTSKKHKSYLAAKNIFPPLALLTASPTKCLKANWILMILQGWFFYAFLEFHPRVMSFITHLLVANVNSNRGWCPLQHGSDSQQYKQKTAWTQDKNHPHYVHLVWHPLHQRDFLTAFTFCCVFTYFT